MAKILIAFPCAVGAIHESSEESVGENFGDALLVQQEVKSSVQRMEQGGDIRTTRDRVLCSQMHGTPMVLFDYCKSFALAQTTSIGLIDGESAVRLAKAGAIGISDATNSG